MLFEKVEVEEYFERVSGITKYHLINRCRICICQIIKNN